jgi:toxin FitB
MNGYLLDTNVLSELRKPKHDQRVAAFVSAQPLPMLFVSVVTLAELRYGIERLDDPARRAEFLAWLNTRVRPLFDGRVLAVSEDVMVTWRMLVERGKRMNHTFSQPDLIIAATALNHGLTIVSRDEGGFAHTGAALINPWS